MNPLSPSILARPVHAQLHGLMTAAKCAALLFATLAPAAGLQAQSNYATPYTITQLAGVVGSPGSLDATGGAARFNRPYGVAVDGAGNVYVADNHNDTIRKITSGGVVTTLAGLAGSPGSTDDTGSLARFNQPYSVAVDGAGNVYVADTYNHVIRKITPGGAVTTLAGLAGSSGATDGVGSAARFFYPQSVATDGSGNVYVADTLNSTIRRITPGGVVTTIAGTAGTSGSTDGAAIGGALFWGPTAVTVDGAGNVYVTDYLNNTIRKISGGMVTTFAGVAGGAGSTDGTGSAARFSGPYGIATDGLGNVFVADTNNFTVRKITPGAVVTTLAGSPGSFGAVDGTGSAASFSGPVGIALDGAGNVYVGDASNHEIRKITSGGVVTTFAGAVPYGSADGTGGAAQFHFPQGVARDGAGNVYVADTLNSTIRKIAPGGVVTTLAGTAGNPGSDDGAGGAASFNYPYGVAVDGAGNVYVADYYNETIRKITAGGVVTTLAGTAGVPGSSDGLGGAARFDGPTGVAVDGSGNVYVADSNSSIIRKIDAGGMVSTLAGSAYNAGPDDGMGSAALFNNPFGVAVDGAGNVFVADTNNNKIRKITAAGLVTSLAGGSFQGSDDGTGSAALFNLPQSVAVDGLGNVYVADTGNNTIRKVSAGGVVTTLAGMTGASGSTDATGSAVRFFGPAGVAADAAGHLYIADTGNNSIRKGVPLIAGDFDGDGSPDIVWQNTSSGDLGYWLMNGTTFASWVDVGVLSTSLRVAATGDFNGDGQTDILWENTATGKRIIWLMNGTGFSSSVNLGIVPTVWRIAAAADFNGDGRPDILWENTATGDRGFYLMNGTVIGPWVGLTNLDPVWRIAGAADFDGDGHPDILWQNTSTGEIYLWLMDGTGSIGSVSLGFVQLEWRIAAVADYNGDGQPDILWEDTVTSERGIWLMNGTSYSGWVSLGDVTTDWRIAP